MEIKLELKTVVQAEADTVVVVCCSKEKPEDALAGTAAQADTAAGGWIEELFQRKEFTGKALETALLHRPGGLAAKHLLVVGGGPAKQFSPGEMRKAAGAAVRTAKAKGSRDISLAVSGAEATPAMVEAAVEGALLGDFEPDHHKTDPKKNEKAVDRFRVAAGDSLNGLAEAVERGRIIGESQNFSRVLANEPANLLTPSRMAREASQMAAQFGLACEVLDEARMRQLGMGALLGVSQGSTEPPALIVIRYKPEVPAAASSAHLALVGKGVTFDTGGVSIKPSEGMEKMKYDMAGAAAVLGAMRALAQLKPRIPVTAFAPCVENMVSGRAQRPGDIVTSYNGKTIEVLNTDAEGRLILVDALSYAIRQGCTHLVDAATLTGAIAVALAHIHAGLFSNDEALRDRLLAAAKVEGERLWPMPLDDDYKDYLKSAFADIPNISGGRYGGAITAAKFLEEFVDEKPWAHLDIAGTAWLDDAKPFLAKGPTGMGVRTFVRLALDWQN
ncbi:MAG: leucyl aminopeptidase [Bryobacterales bacterium]|nr:leucyl aminopeptidase [Bryobacterales bacterium]